MFSGSIFAQSDVGTITGFVKDQSGAVVPNAQVTIKSEATNEAHTVTTDAGGHYTVPNLIPGSYTMLAESKGFKQFISTNNKLQANSTIDIDASLALGQATETVQVSASAEVLQTESGAVQAEVTGQQIQDQELNGRSPIYAAQFLPGVTGTGTLGDFNGVGLNGQPFNVNGARTGDTLVTVDGAPAMRSRANGAVIGVADVDATQEIQVLTADYAAEYGRASGGQIRMVTKSGTTDFHGSAYEYFRNSDLNANTWTRNLAKSTDFASPFRYNNFGYAFGGPVAIPGHLEKFRQKLFFFIAQDWIRERNTQTQTQAVPTNLMRQGNFSELLSANPWYTGTHQIYYPGTCPKAGSAGCVAIPGNIIPTSQLSPNGLAILNAYPAPTPGFLQGTQNWVAQAAQPINQRKDIWNVDIVPDNNNHIELRRSGLDYNEYDPFDQGSGTTAKFFNRPNQTNTVAWTWTASPTLVNEARATYSLDQVFIPVNTSEIGFNRQDLTMPITYPYIFGGKDVAGKIPTVSLNDSFYSLAGGPYPSHSTGPIFTASDSVTKVISNHTLKFGAYFEYIGENDEDQINVATVPGGSNNQNGNFVFTDSGTGATSGVSIANLALGYADSYTEIGPRAYTIWRRPMFEEFAQDSWKITDKLHIDYGVRMSTILGFHPQWANADYFDGALYNPAQAVQINSAGNVILGTGNAYNGVVIPGFSKFPSSAIGRVPAATQNLCAQASCNSLFDPSLSKSYISATNLFQPRLGIAYQIDAKTVIRGGAGEFTTAMPLLDNIFPGGNSPFQPFVTVNNVRVDNPGASLVSGTAAAITATSLNPNLHQPVAWNWNITIQRELPLNSVLSVAYVGHRSYDGWQVYDINQPAAGTLQANPGVNVNVLRPFKGFGPIQEEEAVVNSLYNGLQVNWNRRFTAGSMFGVAYTFAKSLDNGSNYRDIAPDTYNTSNLWGPSEYDIRHVVIINYSYDLPFFRNHRSLLGKTLGGWTISGAVQAQTGTPCGIGSNNDYAGVSSTDLGSFGCGAEGQFWVLNGSPSVTGGFAGSSGNANSVKYFTANVTQPAAGTFNTQRGVRDSVYGPGQQDWNLMLFKKFLINERNAIEFRCEAYDFINHPNWTMVANNFNPTSSVFGEVNGKTNLARNLQLSLRYSF
ncbi:MAG TPA: carboxypeptidase regulatory-like domain-containing protein [Bryobacteraceae bacterium]|nr:carboxypeptidase regulatory-like domain-containing protein [Bryobacteraceae bacterium]